MKQGSEERMDHGSLGFDLPRRGGFGDSPEVPRQAEPVANPTGQQYPKDPEVAGDEPVTAHHVTYGMEQEAQARPHQERVQEATVPGNPAATEKPAEVRSAMPMPGPGGWKEELLKAETLPPTTENAQPGTPPLEGQIITLPVPDHMRPGFGRDYHITTMGVRVDDRQKAAPREDPRPRADRQPVPSDRPAPYPRDEQSRTRELPRGGLTMGLPPREQARQAVPSNGQVDNTGQTTAHEQVNTAENTPRERAGQENTDRSSSHEHVGPADRMPRGAAHEPHRTEARPQGEIVRVTPGRIDGVLKWALGHEGRLPGNIEIFPRDRATVERAADIIADKHPTRSLPPGDHAGLHNALTHDYATTGEALGEAVTGSVLIVAAEQATHLPSLNSRLPRTHAQQEAMHLGWQLVEVVNGRFGDPRAIDPKATARSYTRPGRELAPLLYVQALEVAGPVHPDAAVAALVGFSESRDQVGHHGRLPSGFSGYPREIEALKDRVDQIAAWAKEKAVERAVDPADPQAVARAERTLLAHGLRYVANEHLEARKKFADKQQKQSDASAAQAGAAQLAELAKEHANHEDLDAYTHVVLHSVHDIVEDDRAAMDEGSPNPQPDVDKLIETRAALTELADLNIQPAVERIGFLKTQTERAIVTHAADDVDEIRAGRVEAALAVVIDRINPDELVDPNETGAIRRIQEQTARQARQLQHALTETAYAHFTPDHKGTVTIDRGGKKVEVSLADRFGNRHPQVARTVRAAYVERLLTIGTRGERQRLGEVGALTREADVRIRNLDAVRINRVQTMANALPDDEFRLLPRPVLQLIGAVEATGGGGRESRGRRLLRGLGAFARGALGPAADMR